MIAVPSAPPAGNLNNAMALFNFFKSMGQQSPANAVGQAQPPTPPPNSAQIVPQAPAWNGQSWYGQNNLVNRTDSVKQPQQQQQQKSSGGGGILSAIGGCL